MKKSTKGFLSLVGVGALAAHASLKAISYQMFKKIFEVDDAYLQKDVVDFLPGAELKEKYLNQIDEQVAWFKQMPKKRMQVKSYDGILLDGILIQKNQDHLYMILVHGFNTDRYILLKQAFEFAKRGFNVLMIDQRAYGASDGQYTTFGFKEHLDLIQWIDLIIAQDNEARIGLYGVSMGASTVMMSLGTKLKPNVCFAIEDSGFSELKPQLKLSLQKEIKQGTGLVLNYLENLMKKELGFGFDDVRPIEALKNNEIPICFIHSKDDSIVPYEMASELYAANRGMKAFYPVKSSNHAYACYEDDYFEDLMTFVDKYK